jgi:CorA-like Mg2+ transporter protein
MFDTNNQTVWRLSLVSFVFLPLTFVSGFFGMNVDIFSSDPPLRWFFIVSAPVMVMVFSGWFLLKSALTASNNDPYSRGVYERLYHDLAVQYPALWTRDGPASGTPKLSHWQRCKWALIQYWNDPSKTIRAKNQQSYAENDHFDGLGAWSRFSRLLTRQWTADINAAMTMHREIEQGGPATDHPVKEGIEVVQQALNLSVPGAAQHAEVLHLPNGVGETRYSIPGNEKAHAAAALAAAATSPSPQSLPSDFDHRVTNLQHIGSPPSSGRPSSAGGASHNSGVLIEERPPDAEEADEQRSQDAERRRSGAGEEQQSPDVPVIRGEDDLPLN